MSTRTGHGDRRLLQAVLRVEGQLRCYTPTPRRPSEPPPGADELPAALAEAHRPGEVVGLREIIRATRCTQDAATALRRYARWAGCWPYADPSNPPASWADRPGRRKGGAP